MINNRTSEEKPGLAVVASKFKKMGCSHYLLIPKKVADRIFPMTGFLVEPDALIAIQGDGSFQVKVISHAITEKDFKQENPGGL